MLHSITSLLSSVIEGNVGNRQRRGRFQNRRVNKEEPGKWIWISGSDTAHNFYLYARKSFELQSKPTSATLKTSADSRYKLYVNGHYVGKGPVRSGHGYTYYDTHDIAEFLTKGKNVIAFLIHSFGESTYNYILKRPGLICKAEVQDGEEEVIIATDETWKVRRATDWASSGDRMSKRLGFQEVYDAGAQVKNWNTAKGSEKDWEDAVVLGVPPANPWGRLVAREIPQLDEAKTLPWVITGTYNSPEKEKDTKPGAMPNLMASSELLPLKSGSVQNEQTLLTEDGETLIKTPRNNKGVTIILDFGREVFGNVEIGIADSGKGVIDLGYGENLKDGRITPNSFETKYTDRIMLKGGRLDWQGFEPRAFRYIHLEFAWCSKPVKLEYVRVNQTTYPVELVGHFECSDNILNDIWKTGAYTTHLCMEDTYIDNPSRDRAQRWADARIEARVAYYAFDDTSLLAQGLRQMADSQKRDGSLSSVYPSGEEKIVPDVALLWIYSLLDYYAFADDAGLLRDLYPNIKRLLKWFSRYEDADGLVANTPGKVFIDRANVDKRGNVTALNCMYYHALRVVSIIGSIVGNLDDATEYTEKADKLRIAINKYLYSPKHGLYADCRVNGRLAESFNAQTNTLAALFDIPNQYQKSTIYRQLSNGMKDELQTPYFVSYLLESLYTGEQHEAALKIIRKKWGAMVEAGATTFWEQFDQNGSLCHGYSACPTRDLISEYLGLKPVLGSHRFTLAPHIAGLRWARGSMRTRTGQLDVEWRVNRKSLSIRVEVPEGLKVDIYAPGEPGAKVLFNGKSYPSRFVTVGAGVHRMRITSPLPPEETPLDESLKPRPYQHVELLENANSLRLRQSDRHRGKLKHRRGGREEPLPAVQPVVELIEAPEIATIVNPEPRDTIYNGMETGERPTSEAAETGNVKKSRRRSRRHSRSRAKTTATTALTEAAMEAAPVEQPAAIIPEAGPREAVTSEPVAEHTEETGETQRKRSRRRPRRHSRPKAKTDTATEGTATEESAAIIPEVVAHEAAPVSEPIVKPTEEAEEAQRNKPRRRSHRHSRSKAKTDEATAITETPSEPRPEPKPAITPIPEVASAQTSEAPGESAEAPKKRRRYTPRRGGPRRKPNDETKPEGSEGAG